MENLFGERGDGLDVSEDLLFFVLPLAVVRVLPPRVLGRVPGAPGRGEVVCRR